MTKESTEVAVLSDDSKLLQTLGLDEAQLLEDLESSQSDFGATDITIPFLRVLQQLSPQVTKGKTEYIPEASAGMLINTASKEVFDGEKGIIIIPCKYQSRYIEWRPRSKGGGLVRDFGSDASAALSHVAMTGEKGQQLTAEGNEIVRSYQYWAIIVDEETGRFEQVVLSLASTQAKKSKDWNYVISGRTHTLESGKTVNLAKWPHWFSYRLSTAMESNDMGSWYGVKIQPAGVTAGLVNGPAIFEAAKNFRELIEAGKVKAAAENVHGADEDTQDSPF
jgi:hypothetical protein